MTCAEAKRELSGVLDGGRASQPDVFEAHLRNCPDCEDFRSAAADFAEEYRRQLTAGIGLLRRSEGLAPWEAAPTRGWSRVGVLAAAVLLCWSFRTAGPLPGPAPMAARIVPVATSPSPRLRLADEFWTIDRVDVEELLAFGKEPVLPLRLSQDLLPAGPEDSEVKLPSSLRF